MCLSLLDNVFLLCHFLFSPLIKICKFICYLLCHIQKNMVSTIHDWISSYGLLKHWNYICELGIKAEIKKGYFATFCCKRCCLKAWNMRTEAFSASVWFSFSASQKKNMPLAYNQTEATVLSIVSIVGWRQHICFLWLNVIKSYLCKMKCFLWLNVIKSYY